MTVELVQRRRSLYRSLSKDSGNNLIKNSKESCGVATSERMFVLVLGTVVIVRYKGDRRVLGKNFWKEGDKKILIEL